ncbi:MAG: radical SAM protein [bacterium]|nr:radical SAM protein [bacterium]
MEFGLRGHCFLIRGAKRGAIYDLQSGAVFSIDEHAANLLERCECGEDIDVVFASYDDPVRSDARAFLNALEERKLGGWVHEARDREPKLDCSMSSSLDFIWLEIAAGCNLRCAHCSVSSSPTLIGSERMREEDWARVIAEAHALGCRKLQFIGGEPLLFRDELLRLIASCRALDYQFVEVFTNLTRLNDRVLQGFVANQVAVATSIYGANAAMHDAITKRPGSFARTIGALSQCTAAGLQTRVGVVGMTLNEERLGETERFLREEVGVRDVRVDVVRPVGRANGSALVSPTLLKRIQRTEPRFGRITKEQFARARHGHNCFSKEACVTASGEVFACIMERTAPLGSVLSEPLGTILGSDVSEQFRTLSKDRVEVCRDCEYRYCCFDCRPRAQGMSVNGDRYAKPAECHHDPYTGAWAPQTRGGSNVRTEGSHAETPRSQIG